MDTAAAIFHRDRHFLLDCVAGPWITACYEAMGHGRRVRDGEEPGHKCFGIAPYHPTTPSTLAMEIPGHTSMEGVTLFCNVAGLLFECRSGQRHAARHYVDSQNIPRKVGVQCSSMKGRVRKAGVDKERSSVASK